MTLKFNQLYIFLEQRKLKYSKGFAAKVPLATNNLFLFYQSLCSSISWNDRNWPVIMLYRGPWQRARFKEKCFLLHGIWNLISYIYISTAMKTEIYKRFCNLSPISNQQPFFSFIKVCAYWANRRPGSSVVEHRTSVREVAGSNPRAAPTL